MARRSLLNSIVEDLLRDGTGIVSTWRGQAVVDRKAVMLKYSVSHMTSYSVKLLVEGRLNGDKETRLAEKQDTNFPRPQEPVNPSIPKS